MLGGTKVFPIEEGFRRLSTRTSSKEAPRGPQFREPQVVTFEGVELSRVIDEELDRFYNPSGPVEVLTRVFRRFRKSG